MDVLCVDKKGTITMNQLAVIGVIALNHATESDVLFAGALASQGANQDPIDLAFLAAAKERQIFDGVTAVTPVSFAPFDAKNRRTKAVVEQNGQRLRVMKGAVRTVAEASGLQPPAIETLEARVSESALKGYRTLAIARGPEAGAPALVGLVTLYNFTMSSGTSCLSGILLPGPRARAPQSFACDGHADNHNKATNSSFPYPKETVTRREEYGRISSRGPIINLSDEQVSFGVSQVLEK
jgi:hypothetical protein